MTIQTHDIVIIGAGISGMATAAFLQQRGHKVLVLEKNPEAGGVMKTIKDGDYIFDMGSNSSIEKNLAIGRLVDYLDIRDQMLFADRAASKRYILKDDKLHALSGPQNILTTNLISGKAKWKMFGEFRRKAKTDTSDESLASFVRRRFGDEVLDYIVNPVIAGIYAGNPDSISMQANFPDLAKLEQEYGSVIKGMFKKPREKKDPAEQKPSKNIYSFKEGMQFLPKTIATRLGDAMVYEAEILSVEKRGDKYAIKYQKEGKDIEIEANTVVSTAPAYAAKDYLKPLDNKISAQLSRIYYPPVIVMSLVYKADQFDKSRKLDSFGFLVPEKEQKSYLGAIWSSVIFNNRTPEGEYSFTIMIGGARVPNLLQQDYHRIMQQAQLEFEFIMKITRRTVKKRHVIWTKAIPQYQLNYPDFLTDADRFEQENSNFYLSGNYRGGFSTADCILNAEKIAEKINKSVKN